MISPLFVILHRDDILLFESPHTAEAYLEPEYNREEDKEPIYDAEGRLLRWYLNPTRSIYRGDIWRLEVASEDPMHALVLRADLLCYLAHDAKFTGFEESLFALTLSQLVEIFRQNNEFTA